MCSILTLKKDAHEVQVCSNLLACATFLVERDDQQEKEMINKRRR